MHFRTSEIAGLLNGGLGFPEWGTRFPESGPGFPIGGPGFPKAGQIFEIERDIFAASRKAKLSGVDRLKIRPYYWILDPIKQILFDFWPFSG